MRKKVEIKAVYDKDLQQVLANLGILDKLITGKLSCAVCGCQVDLDNLGTIFPEDGKVGPTGCEPGRQEDEDDGDG